MLSFQTVEQNVLAVFRHFARVHESGEIREMPGVSIASSGVTFHMFNTAFLSQPVSAAPSELERRIMTAAVHFGARGARWAYWVFDDCLEEPLRKRAPDVFRRHGLRLVSECPGMLAEALRPPLKPLPALDIRRIDGQQGRLAFSHVTSVVFGIPFPWCVELYDVQSLWEGDYTGYVGYVEGEPVAAVTTMLAAGAAGVYSVATLPGYGRRGYAEAIMRHALERVREAHGVERSILQSTAVALPLYRRMGYETVARITVYSS